MSKTVEDILQEQLDRIGKGNTTQIQFCYQAIFVAMEEYAYNRECKRVDELTEERDHWLETAKSHGTKIRELEGLLKERDEYIASLHKANSKL